jgi:hypothetical protein
MTDRVIRYIAVAIVIGVAVAGALVWAVVPRTSTVNCVAYSNGQTPLQTFLAFGSPLEQTVGQGHWYNFTLEDAGAGLHFNNLKFQTQSPAGSVVVPGAGWNFTVLSPMTAWLGTYSLTGPTAENWSMGGPTALFSGQTFDLLVTPGNISGDNFVVMLTGAHTNGCPATGSVRMGIP